MKSVQEEYAELSCYTLSHQSSSFIHQYIVDAFAAQNADENTKPITITFALTGLYLHIEKGYTGRDVQKAHMKLAKYRKQWPSFMLPKDRGDITVSDVIKAPAGDERDKMIDVWCTSVWNAYHSRHNQIEDLIQKLGYSNLPMETVNKKE